MLKTKHRIGFLTEIKTGLFPSVIFRTLTDILCSFYYVVCVFLCVYRLWLCGLWQPCSSPEGCGLTQSQWSPGTDGEGKLQSPRPSIFGLLYLLLSRCFLVVLSSWSTQSLSVNLGESWWCWWRWWRWSWCLMSFAVTIIIVTTVAWCW